MVLNFLSLTAKYANLVTVFNHWLFPFYIRTKWVYGLICWTTKKGLNLILVSLLTAFLLSDKPKRRSFLQMIFGMISSTMSSCNKHPTGIIAVDILMDRFNRLPSVFVDMNLLLHYLGDITMPLVRDIVLHI